MFENIHSFKSSKSLRKKLTHHLWILWFTRQDIFEFEFYFILKNIKKPLIVSCPIINSDRWFITTIMPYQISVVWVLAMVCCFWIGVMIWIFLFISVAICEINEDANNSHPPKQKNEDLPFNDIHIHIHKKKISFGNEFEGKSKKGSTYRNVTVDKDCKCGIKPSMERRVCIRERFIKKIEKKTNNN